MQKGAVDGVDDGAVDGLAEIDGKLVGLEEGELDGAADFVGEFVIVGELVGGREWLPPPQTQQCFVAGPKSPAYLSATEHIAKFPLSYT